MSRMPRWFPLLVLILGLATARPGWSQVRPLKGWFSPTQPLTFTNDGAEDVALVLTDFAGEPVPASAGEAPVVQAGDQVVLPEVFPTMRVGTYLLYSVAPGQDSPERFLGTPWVIRVIGHTLPGQRRMPMVTRVEPLRYAVIETDHGDMVAGFFYDVAPNTVSSFLSLAEEGFFDGLSFHRIVPGFVIQGGDPLNNTEGGPGYEIDAEFNDRPHLPGMLSMAREGDPLERQGAMPRDPWADTAGSQFFIPLDYATTKRLDGRYTVFGRVVDGMDAVHEIGSAEIADPATGRPVKPQLIRRIRVELVTAEHNPYPRLFDFANVEKPATQESGSRTTQPASGG